VDAVHVRFAVRVNEIIGLRMQLHVEPALQQMPQEIVVLAESGPEIAEIEAYFSHAETLAQHTGHESFAKLFVIRPGFDFTSSSQTLSCRDLWAPRAHAT
jgi:hypothetical protein